MSRDDQETRETLLNPFIEIGRGVESRPIGRAEVNVETFKDCLRYLTPSRDEGGPKSPDFPFFSIYGVVGYTVSGAGGAYLNLGEAPMSRTLMGHLSEKVLRQKLPKTYESLTGQPSTV